MGTLVGFFSLSFLVLIQIVVLASAWGGMKQDMKNMREDFGHRITKLEDLFNTKTAANSTDSKDVIHRLTKLEEGKANK